MDKEKYQKALGSNIRSRRLALELSQDDLAKATGLSNNTISRIELGSTNVKVGTLNEIATALKTKSAKLLPS